jgi:hypothetical protein
MQNVTYLERIEDNCDFIWNEYLLGNLNEKYPYHDLSRRITNAAQKLCFRAMDEKFKNHRENEAPILRRINEITQKMAIIAFATLHPMEQEARIKELLISYNLNPEELFNDDMHVEICGLDDF